jgi:hypothetical protein
VPQQLVLSCGAWLSCITQIRAQLRQLKLNDSEVWAREEKRKAALGDVDAPWFVKAPFWLLCVMLDVCFAHRCADELFLVRVFDNQAEHHADLLHSFFLTSTREFCNTHICADSCGVQVV